MRQFLLVTTILVGLLTLFDLPLQVVAQETDPESVLRAVFGALNNKDVDGALELVADDATITIVEGFNQFVFTGREEIREWWELVITGENSITLVGNFLVEGDKAIWSARVSNDPWNALNVSPIHCHAESVVQDGLLKSHKFILSAESIMKIRTEANKEIARRWVEEIWNNGDLLVIDEIVAEDYVDRSPAVPGRTDREAIKSGVTEFRTAFPDAHFTIDAMMAEGDRVVVPQTFTGTHQGELHGAPATGNQVTWMGIFIYRIQNGKIVERWGALDTLGFMIQIGAVPPPGEGGK